MLRDLGKGSIPGEQARERIGVSERIIFCYLGGGGIALDSKQVVVQVAPHGHLLFLALRVLAIAGGFGSGDELGRFHPHAGRWGGDGVDVLVESQRSGLIVI